MKTRAGLDAIVGHVKHDIREFVDAVLALSDDPDPANLQRYLAASRELEDSRRPRARGAQAAPHPRFESGHAAEAGQRA